MRILRALIFPCFVLASTVAGSAFELTNCFGQWKGLWTVQIGPYSASEAVRIEFSPPRSFAYFVAGQPTANRGSFSVQKGEIIVQFGAAPEDIMILRNVRSRGDSLSFEAAVATLDPLIVETNEVVLNRVDSAEASESSVPTKASPLMELARKYVLPLPFPVLNPSVLDRDRIVLKKLLKEHVGKSIRSDANFPNYDDDPLDVWFDRDRVHVFVPGRVGNSSHDLIYNALLQDRALDACRQVFKTNQALVIHIEAKGLGAFSMVSSPKLKPKYLNGNKINKTLLWDECLTVASKSGGLNFDSATFSSDAHKQWRISSVIRPVPADVPGVVVVERLTVCLTPFQADPDTTIESVSLAVDYEQYRRRAASRAWQRIQCRTERMLRSGGPADGSARGEADEAVLDAVLRQVCGGG